MAEGKSKKDPSKRQPGTSLTRRQYEILLILLEAESRHHAPHVMEIYEKLQEPPTYPALICSLNYMEKKKLIFRARKKVNRSVKSKGSERGVPKSCRVVFITDKGRRAMPDNSVSYGVDVPSDMMESL